MLCVGRTDIGGFAIFITGLGLFTLQNEETTVAQWASYQCVAALRAGVHLNSQLPAYEKGLREQDQATASATWGFIRSIGWVWGVAIPAAIFNNRINELIHEILDSTAAKLIASGGAFGAASAAQIQHFPFRIQEEMRSVYARVLQRVFQISIAFAGLALILSLAEHKLTLREALETQFGLEREEEKKKNHRGDISTSAG
ncbi:multidrug resistance protein fnx1 [Moelleriella libera RCEF 2490]|uniref:Multidrug resistance protein fnx1 n=1 Tax=Moelleriella libera RCEF 2490 TaxID=1081109 RepID=A0A167WR15_9HYPO|nr:multidrug resistance protein fnx1 [Moelleriella libera RCEF 2490]